MNNFIEIFLFIISRAIKIIGDIINTLLHPFHFFFPKKRFQPPETPPPLINKNNEKYPKKGDASVRNVIFIIDLYNNQLHEKNINMDNLIKYLSYILSWRHRRASGEVPAPAERRQWRRAWVCLLLQLFSITSPVVAAVTTPQPSAWASDLLNRPAQVYQLAPGETSEMIAERLGLTLPQLQTYNQFRSFSKPFAHLSAGDELDIPASGMKITPSSALTPSAPPSAEKTADLTGDDSTARLAGQLNGLAGIAASGDISNAATEAARSAITGTASQTIEQWLGQFGTVQAQLSMNDDWRLEDSSIDWLVPLYETPGNLLFTQLGWRNKDDRNTVNLGLGMRLFTTDSMVGFNSFYDADITGDNRRLGLGLEYWRDYITASANGYFRLTDWHQSIDFADYDERPANGWDIRLNGWLPAYPQIGGKLVYEKYYGESVALFGSDDSQRQKNPYAITTGIHWTPFPLLTVGLDHRAGEDDQKEASINLQLTWKPDESWGSQISSSEVDGMRRLSGSRHNLIDRNNNIILDYRKQMLIKSSVGPSAIKDVPGSAHSVTVQVNSKYPLQQVSWDNAAFLAAGGTFTQTDITQARLTLPAHRASQTSVGVMKQTMVPVTNFYVLTATAVDNNGNRGTPQELTVEVLPPQLSFSGEMMVTGDNAPADGKTPVTVIATVLDSNGAPFADQTVNMKVVYADGSEHVRDTVTDAKGQTQNAITSTVSGKATVTATAGNISQQSIITFTDIAISAERSSLTVSPDTIVADGVSFSTLSLAANNQSGQPQSGLNDVIFRVTGVDGASVTRTEEISPGVYVARLSGTQAGQVQVTPATTGITFTELTRTVTLTGNDATAGIAPGALSVLNDGAKADGAAQNRVRATVADANGNPLAGQTVSFSADNGASIAVSGITGADGGVTVSLSSTVAGASTVTASVNGSGQTVTVNFVADDATAGIAPGALSVLVDGAKADGTAHNRVRATVTDANGNPLAGQTVSFSADNGAVIGASSTTDVNGETTMPLKSVTSGQSKVTASFNGSSQEVIVNFVAGDADTATSTISATPVSVVADGTSESVIILTLKDINGNAVVGQSVAFSSSLAGSFVGNVTDHDDGTYTAALTGRKIGQTNITAQVNGSAFSVTPAVVTLVAGNPDAAHSSLVSGSGSILADGNASARLTITLKDIYDNVVTGQTVNFISSLQGTTVGNVTDNDDGTYTADLTGTSEGITSITALVNGSAFSVPAVSVELIAILTLSTNGKNYSSTSGFPGTGFRNADFQILLNGSVPANYTWSSNRPWVQVSNNGKVTLAGTPSGGSKTVTLTGNSSYGGTPQVYTFTVNHWFTTPGNLKMNGNDGRDYCSSNGAVQISAIDGDDVFQEWGGLNAYPASDFGTVADSEFI
ncbi:inverse autotransporter beta domain-containing protein, partial [Pluralibacter sp.]|uniref:inverse autotransporter beta domain-containing protein n=1 Tax=Pluralibacter sp. TaxID=1920032 RepID=UPI0025D85B17